jgi:hypothetical protein
MEELGKKLKVADLFRNQYQNHPRQCIIITFWLMAILLGIFHAWTGRHSMGPDGISYLDIGDAYFRGDWNMALNAYWSPFYSWLLGLLLFLLKPSSYNEFTIVHIVNFVIYLFALGSFHFFLIGLLRFHRNWAVTISKDGDVALSEGVLLALGYTLFIWSSLRLITIEAVTPDMLVSAFVYLISGILLRIRLGANSWLRFIIFGIVLGFSYFSKSIFYIASSVFLPGNLRKAIPRTLVTLVSFLLIVSPFIFALSKTKGRFTFGDAGKLNYLWLVNHEPDPSLEDRTLKHPVRLIPSIPVIYEFGTPIYGTYPLWYDPSYWSEGVKLKFHLGRQVNTLKSNIERIFNDLEAGIIVYGILIFHFMSYRERSFMKGMLEYWFLTIPAVLALAMYSLVLVEPRYIGPFIVLLCMGLFSAVRVPDSQGAKRWMRSTVISMLLLISIPIAYSVMQYTYSILSHSVQGKSNSNLDHVHWQVADGMKQMGFHSGDKICYVGDSYGAYWARLARLQIVAYTQPLRYISFSEANCLVDPVFIKSLAKIKVKGIVAQMISEKSFPHTNWKQIGNTDYYVYSLERQSTAITLSAP